MVKFGAIAREQRHKLGLSQQEVADQALCNRETVCLVERNARSVGIDIVQNIYNVLGLEITVKEAKHDD